MQYYVKMSQHFADKKQFLYKGEIESVQEFKLKFFKELFTAGESDMIYTKYMNYILAYCNFQRS